jgi:hypothetical protein
MMGSTLGPYRLDRELGAGGMGKVFAARVEGRVPGLDVGALVALKVVHSHPLTGIDHVLAMVAVGIWGAQLGRPAI